MTAERSEAFVDRAVGLPTTSGQLESERQLVHGLVNEASRVFLETWGRRFEEFAK